VRLENTRSGTNAAPSFATSTRSLSSTSHSEGSAEKAALSAVISGRSKLRAARGGGEAVLRRQAQLEGRLFGAPDDRPGELERLERQRRRRNMASLSPYFCTESNRLKGPSKVTRQPPFGARSMTCSRPWKRGRAEQVADGARAPVAEGQHQARRPQQDSLREGQIVAREEIRAGHWLERPDDLRILQIGEQGALERLLWHVEGARRRGQDGGALVAVRALVGRRGDRERRLAGHLGVERAVLLELGAVVAELAQPATRARSRAPWGMAAAASSSSPRVEPTIERYVATSASAIGASRSLSLSER
jgi:hypothetical protein